jgi:hypothetical protein
MFTMKSLGADPSDRRGIAHMADADDQRREHQRTDDHLDQPEEDRADDRHVLGDLERSRLVGQRIEARDAENDAENEPDHHVEEILVHRALHRGRHPASVSITRPT